MSRPANSYARRTNLHKAALPLQNGFTVMWYGESLIYFSMEEYIDA